MLELARGAIEQAVIHNEIPGTPVLQGRLSEPGGAFVTIFSGRRLRGCVGLAEGRLALGETVVQAAVGASRGDPRFAPLCAAELPDVVIEISVLSEPAPILPEQIEIGRHGILIVRESRRGLLLPQVAWEHLWDPPRFLEETCRKAGLWPGAWREAKTQIFGFQAEVFSESEFAAERAGAARN